MLTCKAQLFFSNLYLITMLNFLSNAMLRRSPNSSWTCCTVRVLIFDTENGLDFFIESMCGEERIFLTRRNSPILVGDSFTIAGS